MSARKKSTPIRSLKKQRRRSPRVPQPRRKWDNIIERLSKSVSGKTRVTMGSELSAQVTRVRLLKTYEGIFVKTQGKTIIIETWDT